MEWGLTSVTPGVSVEEMVGRVTPSVISAVERLLVGVVSVVGVASVAAVVAGGGGHAGW